MSKIKAWPWTPKSSWPPFLKYSGQRTFTKKNIPAVGASIGIDRLFAALQELEIAGKGETTIQVLVTFLEKDLVKEYLKFVGKLRTKNINTFFYFEPDKLSKQLKFADKNNIPLALIYGTEEKKKNVVTIKNLEKKTQKRIKKRELINFLKKRRLS